MKINKKIKKMFNLYNIAIAGCIIIVIVSLCIIFLPNKSKSKNEIEIVQSGIEETKEITEDEARKLAVEQFKKIGEKIKKDELAVSKIKRDTEEYYYIRSKDNSLEIRIKGRKN